MRPVLLIFFLCGAMSVFAQSPAYLHYDVSDGLPSGLVYTIAQDARGLLWFGTDKGLARFDGTRFRNYTMRDGLPDPEIINLFEDSHQRLWLSCFRKKLAYRQDGKLITEKQDTLLTKMNVKGDVFDFFEDGDGIWIASGLQTVYRWRPSELTTVRLPDGVKRIRRIGGELFALGRYSILKMKGNSAATPFYKVPLTYDSGRGTVAITFDENRVLYTFHERILLLEYDGERFIELDSLTGISATHAHTDRQGRFWVVSPMKGAFCFDHRKNNLRKPTIFLAGKKLSHILEDREGTVWFATLNEGVYALPKNAIINYSKENYPVLQSNNFTALSTLTDGRIVAGDDSGNLYFYDSGHWKIHSLGSFDGYNRVRQILPLKNAGWLAVTDESLEFSDKSQPPPFEDLSLGSPKCAFAKGDSVWIGTSHQLFLYSKSTREIKFLLANRTMTLGKDSEGNIWAGGLDFLSSEKDNFSTSWGERFLPLSGRIADIESAGPGALWLSSPDYGLLWVRVEKGKILGVQVMNEVLSSPIDNIQAIYMASGGTIWLATNKGIFSVDKDLNLSHINEKNGLANNDVNAVLVRGDTLWAATVAGLSRIMLRGSPDQRSTPTLITGINYHLGQAKISIDLLDTLQQEKQLNIPPGTSLLEVSLAALHYWSRSDIFFEYISIEEPLPFFMLTWDNIARCLWNDPDTILLEEANRNYGAHIHPGCYRIKVAGIFPGDQRSDVQDERILMALPFWWQTIWASLAVVGLLVLAIWWIIRTQAAFQKLRNVTLELQLQAIKAQINPHFIGNSINAIQQFFYPSDPLKASQYITIFSDLLRRTMLLSEKNFIPLKEEAAYVKDYLEMIALRFGNRFTYEIQGLEEVPGSTPFPAMLLQPVLENATLHGLAPEGVSRLRIAFKMSDQFLICSISDNGVGIDAARERKKTLPSKRPSKGLSLLQKKVDTLNQLHPIQLKLEVTDVTKQTQGREGTRAVISFIPEKINLKALEKVEKRSEAMKIPRKRTLFKNERTSL